MKLAIDFGTTNTVIARWNVGIPEIVNVPDLSVNSDTLPALVPSLVYVHQGQVIVGQAVRGGDSIISPIIACFATSNVGSLPNPVRNHARLTGCSGEIETLGRHSCAAY